MSDQDCPTIGFGLLSTIGYPLLPYYLEAAARHGVRRLSVICDSKQMSEKDKGIFRDRTGGAFESDGDLRKTVYGFAEERVAFYFVDNHNSDAALRLYQALGIECLINAGTPRKISNRILAAMRHGVVNVHPGILPEYRGCSAVEWAIYNDSQVGNTAHFMGEGYDTGPIIEIEAYEFPHDADYQSMRIKVYRSGCDLAGRALARIQETGMTPDDASTQDEARACYWDPITPEKMADVLKKVDARSYRYQLL